ncbi:uncharacterized protein C12orf56 homolog isoform X8 [Macaca fascicularis]|uniref:uncharacterized protein C12orf56 homolog isoform X8 n=1 Tax=Macaca fascicularis TaxID=9541 RepID=UPI003D153755
MACPLQSGFPARTNSRLDVFLRRHLPPEVYDAVRAYEPCIVVSNSENHTLKYVVLSDRLIYLTENPPKSIRRVVALRDVVAIDLIDDYPEFLSSPDGEISQHIRIIYSSTVLKKECKKSNGVRKFLFPFHHTKANNEKVKEEKNGLAFWRIKEPRSLNESPLRSEEKIKHFSQLKSELFLKDNSLRRILPLIMELKVAAQKNFILKRLFWKLQKLILEYTNTATALLYEILLVFQQGNLGLGSRKFAISWMMSFLQSCPPIITFVASIVKQVVRGLSASFQLLTPCQAVLLYQQFYILKSCLQHSRTLAEYIKNNYREEFRYFIHMPALQKRLPLCYPITQHTTQLFHEVLKLVE